MATTGAPWNLFYPLGTDLVRDGAGDIQQLAEDVAAGLTNASVIRQVVSTTMTSTFTGSVTGSGVWADITGYSVTITPTSETSRILLIGNIVVGYNASTTEDRHMGIRMLRNATQLENNSGAGSRSIASFFSQNGGFSRDMFPMALVFDDAPATTSPVTYKAQYLLRNDGGSTGIKVNGYVDDNDTARSGAGQSTLLAIEVAA
jgi:hypothetical protein